MSSEIVMKLNVIVLLPPMFINEHSFEVVREKFCVGGQIKLEIPGVEKKRVKCNVCIYLNMTLFSKPRRFLSSFCVAFTFVSVFC